MRNVQRESKAAGESSRLRKRYGTLVTLVTITEFKVHRQKLRSVVANGIIYIAEMVFTFHSWHQQPANWMCAVRVHSKPLLFISDECLALNYMVFLYSTLFSLHFSAIKGGTLMAVVVLVLIKPRRRLWDCGHQTADADIADAEMLWLRLRPMLQPAIGICLSTFISSNLFSFLLIFFFSSLTC